MNACPAQTVAPGERITALAVGLTDPDVTVLREVFQHCDWTLIEAPGSREALVELSLRSVPVVVCARDLPDGTWPAFLKSLQAMSCPPNLILTSGLVDSRLWAEVLNLGGYDVLPSPFEPYELVRVLKVAWISWRYEWEWGYAAPKRCIAGAA